MLADCSLIHQSSHGALVPARYTSEVTTDSGLIESDVRTGLNPADHRRYVLFEAYAVFPAEQNRRTAALPRLDHKNLIEIDQDLSCRRSGSFQCDKNGHLAPRDAIDCCRSLKRNPAPQWRHKFHASPRLWRRVINICDWLWLGCSTRVSWSGG